MQREGKDLKKIVSFDPFVYTKESADIHIGHLKDSEKTGYYERVRQLKYKRRRILHRDPRLSAFTILKQYGMDEYERRFTKDLQGEEILHKDFFLRIDDTLRTGSEEEYKSYLTKMNQLIELFNEIEIFFKERREGGELSKHSHQSLDKLNP